MVSFNKRAKTKVEVTRLPCQISIMDFFQNGETNKFTRIAIEQHPSFFAVIQWTVKERGKDVDLSLRKMIETKHLWEAKEKLEEISTCLELENWEFDNEENYVLYDVNSNIGDHLSNKIDCISEHEYVKTRSGRENCRVRQIPKGFYCALSIDPYGEVWIKHGDGPSIKAPNAISINYLDIVRIPGSRGFAVEGIFDGSRFFATDILFSHDSWKDKNEYRQRENQWVSYARKNAIENVHMLQQHPVNTSAIGALLNNTVHALMVYDIEGRVAVSEFGARNVNVGGEQNKILYDEKFNKLGMIYEPGELDLSYKNLNCLHLNTGSLGLVGVFI